MATKISMDDINAVLIVTTDAITGKVALTDQQQDELWDQLSAVLEKFFGYPDYRNYN